KSKARTRTQSATAVTKEDLAMSGTLSRRALGIALLAAVTAAGLLAKPVVAAAQSIREADGARLLKGALDLHFHMDPWVPDAVTGQAGIAEVRIAQSRGM